MCHISRPTRHSTLPKRRARSRTLVTVCGGLAHRVLTLKRSGTRFTPVCRFGFRTGSACSAIIRLSRNSRTVSGWSSARSVGGVMHPFRSGLTRPSAQLRWQSCSAITTPARAQVRGHRGVRSRPDVRKQCCLAFVRARACGRWRLRQILGRTRCPDSSPVARDPQVAIFTHPS
jgi:hypothetical protein